MKSLIVREEIISRQTNPSWWHSIHPVETAAGIPRSIAYGDPEMIYLSPVEQGSKDALFYANRKTFIDFNYLNVMVQTTGIPSLRLDGAPFDPANIITHPNNPAYSVAVIRIFGPAGQHRLTSDSIFNATIYRWVILKAMDTMSGPLSIT